MKNEITASVLRNVVAKFANVHSTKIILKGEISPNFSVQDYFKNGSMGSSKNSFGVYGWSPETGFIPVNECIGEDSSSNYAHSDRTDIAGLDLHECQNVDKYLFFVVHEYGHNSWEGCNQELWDTWTLYKAPNFKETWDKIQLEEVQRLEDFINTNA